MHLRHAHDLVLARTHVAALADHASDEEVVSAYEHILIELDRLHDDHGPDIDPDTLTADSDHWFELAITTIANLVRHGVDPLGVELICWMLLHARSAQPRQARG